MLFGLGKILQEQGKTLEAKVLFDELEKNYGWSPKVVAASLGIAEALYEKKEYEDALEPPEGDRPQHLEKRPGGTEGAGDVQARRRSRRRRGSLTRRSTIT